MRSPRSRSQHQCLLHCVVISGSSSILHPERPHFPQVSTLSAVVETCVKLRSLGHRVVIVSSGAIGMGLHRMQLPALGPGKKRAIGEKQALAAIGQGRLIALWDQLFGMLQQPIAQILITRNDIADRSRYLNATTTLSTLLHLGVIPIINENDTISVSEILHINKFGDNDTLSAVAAGMCGADYLFLLTDVDGLYEDNPRKVPGASRVKICRDIEVVRKMVSTATLGSSLGTGGMETKLIAAELANGAGCATVITLGSAPHRIVEIVQNHHQHHPSSPPKAPSSTTNLASATPDLATTHPSEFSNTSRTHSHPNLASELPPPSSTDTDPLPAVEFALAIDPLPYTLFTPRPRPLTSRRFWILHGLTPRGTVYVDEGAYRVISRGERDGGGGGNGGRLLAAGVVRVEGVFAAGQAVRVCVIKGRKKKKKSTSSTFVREGVEVKKEGVNSFARRELEASTNQSIQSRPVSPDHFAERGRTTESRCETFTPGSASASQSRHASVSASRRGVSVNRSRGEEGGSTSTVGGSGAGSSSGLDLGSEEGEEVVEFGRGLTNYNSAEIDRVKGLRSSDIEKILGYSEAEHVVESIVEVRNEATRA
ncbi:BZ3500_MvSof-1268-A1-R1_Chr4-3g07345 [Microbotryum saponariae]|uniref:BZ3500_MvSof-1268-A1-R1_Chr4-3g07345 protein n=1 Tax=Microbotryum saponariae TaxID=289078 RepID=A0A2X0LNX4_9BASI|nr:BZ3500_MvSof-1268-A1-R1_Chr4-3g07345 [Microbotryum saponariae]SDA07008.1 BZ3501_MvSof-1269-A2-R1_Chr4-2g07054 [Microbotryum saponariae]